MSARPIYGPRLLDLAHNLLNGAAPETMARMLVAVSEGVSRLEEAHLLLREASTEMLTVLDGRQFGAALARLQRVVTAAPERPVDAADEELRRAEAQALQHRAAPVDSLFLDTGGKTPLTPEGGKP